MGLKNSKWVYYYYYWLIMGLHLVAILLFTKGFLLTRTELPYYSHCSDVTQSPCLHSFSSDINPNLNQSHHNHQCWTKPTIGRLIIIVLDALRLPLFYTRVEQNNCFCYVGQPLSLSSLSFFLFSFRFDFVAPSTFFQGQHSHFEINA